MWKNTQEKEQFRLKNAAYEQLAGFYWQGWVLTACFELENAANVSKLGGGGVKRAFISVCNSHPVVHQLF